jgi:hypothetical protein
LIETIIGLGGLGLLYFIAQKTAIINDKSHRIEERLDKIIDLLQSRL